MAVFKAPLIKFDQFYTYRRITALMSIFFPIGFTWHLFDDSATWLVILNLILILVFGFLAWHAGKGLKRTLGQDKINCSSDSITLDRGHETMTLPIEEIERIELYNADRIIGENQWEWVRELFGRSPKQMIIIDRKSGQSHQYKFYIESYYMIEQLKKLVVDWQEKGVTVEMK